MDSLSAVGGVVPGDRELAVLRYLRDHGVATISTIAHEVFGAPRTTFGRVLKRKPAEETLTGLVAAALVAQTGHGANAEFTLTQQGRQTLRNVALGPPFTNPLPEIDKPDG